jgi:quinol monooxygenase YgiN
VAVTVLVRLQAKPGEGDKLVEVVKAITPDSIDKDGAGAFELVRDLDDPDTVVMIEKWRDRASHEAYVAWRAETGIGAAELGEVMGAAPEIRYLETVGEWN